ncbi:hypothetical protein F5Y16DRAFT_377246 [Xylariaceae sp. FL0255]|nr:hypothetical protein F5Y16DRAFT_377246 [Xylariaceae sp. FL0255]
MTLKELNLTCHCGAAKQGTGLVVGDYSDDNIDEPTNRIGIDLCHCAACRHSTGVLCASYLNVSYSGMIPPANVEGLSRYPLLEDADGHVATGGISRYFCSTCGCHVFLHKDGDDGDEHAFMDPNDDHMWLPKVPEARWAVATGVITELTWDETRGIDGGDETDERDTYPLIKYLRHINTESTRDGGLSTFIRSTGNSGGLEVVERWDPTQCSPMSLLGHVEAKDRTRTTRVDGGVGEKGKDNDVLNGSCQCGTVRFHITRPNEASRLPRSNFADLLVPYHTGSSSIENLDDEKWWLYPSRRSTTTSEAGGGQEQKQETSKFTRYLAGTCACRSCRLNSGFEIQTWAFVPMANILFHVPASVLPSPDIKSSTPTATTLLTEAGLEEIIIPLDFNTLPSGLLKSYESKPGVRREFCARCGATVFWRDRWRPKLMDVSVGLLDADEGALARDWLCWYTGRVSFAEEAVTDRRGCVARWAKELIGSLERGLGEWGGD